jgi:hypothetical protein
MDLTDATDAMCPDVRFYPDPVLLCRADLGTPGFFLLMLRTSPLKGGSDDLKRVIEIDYM